MNIEERRLMQSDFKEARSGVYALSEYSLELAEMMVDYFYVGHYDVRIRVASKLSLSMHSSMLALADKYDIQGTQREVTKGLIDQISDASQDFLKEVMMSVMSTPLKSRCGDCKQQARSLKVSQEIRDMIPYPIFDYHYFVQGFKKSYDNLCKDSTLGPESLYRVFYWLVI
ncbi:hypothetical protein DER46DRAFT_580337 [Fusarium sp. MPI-SDFR-AT-0072]|nr:hypothetical protein DER46DRAFT_580337 [Fusarium sp. MPI-SDFR-AT-0072]